MVYEPQFEKPYADGWEDQPSEKTPISAAVLNAYDAAHLAEEEQLRKTTKVFDNTIGSVLSGNDRGNVRPVRTVVVGANNAVSEDAMRCLVGGQNNEVGSVNNTVNGEKNVLDNTSIDNNVSGYGNAVNGNYNIVGGYKNVVDSDNANVVGKGLKSYSSTQEGQMIGGNYNDSEEEIVKGVPVLFGIGNGNNDTDRSNALLVDKNGNLKVKGKVYFDGDKEAGSGGGGAKQSAVYSDYYYAVSALNSASNTDFEKGQEIKIIGEGKCAIWVVDVVSTQVVYNYSGTFIEDIRQAVKLQIGYYMISLVGAEAYAPASITLSNHYELVSRLMSGSNNALETIKLTVGQIVNFRGGLCALYIDSRISSFANYTYEGTLEADITAAGGLIQIGNYMVGLVKGYVDSTGEGGSSYTEEDKAELEAYIDEKFAILTSDILGGAS